MPPGIQPAVFTAMSQAQPLVVIPPSTNWPTLVEVDQHNWHVNWPDGFDGTGYVWTVQIATNLTGIWIDQEQQWDPVEPNTLVVTPPPAPWFMRLHGTTNDLQ